MRSYDTLYKEDALTYQLINDEDNETRNVHTLHGRNPLGEELLAESEEFRIELAS